MVAVQVRRSYTAAEFARLINRESERVELKSGVGHNPLQDAMVALSNVDGGVVFVGVKDDRTVVGRSHDQGVDDKIHEAALAATNVGRYTITEVEVDGKPVIAITVRRREEGFAQTSNGRVLVRRGGRNVALFGADLASFVQERALRRFETSPTEIALASADQHALREMAEAFGWPARATDLQPRLVEQGLATREGNLTVAGALVLTDPRDTLRQNKATVEVRRYPSDAGSSEYDRRVEFGGPLPQQVRDATQFIVAELGSDLIVTGLYRHDLPKLPEVVVREAVANAVAHRSYENSRTSILVEMRPSSVSVTSPGPLPEPVTVETLRQAQAARNQDVINVLRRFRLAEDAGRGIDVMEDTMAEALLEPPRFIADDTSVRVELSLRGPITTRERAWISDLERQGNLVATDRLLLVHAARGEQLTNKTARTILSTGESEARRALQRLRDAGLLIQRGTRGGAVYSLVEQVAPPAAYRMSPEQVADLVVEAAVDGPLTNELVRSLTGLSREQTLTLLRRLVADERLRTTGERRGTRYHAV